MIRVLFRLLYFRILRMAKNRERPQEKALTKPRPRVKTSSRSSLLPINLIIITVSLVIAVWFGYKGYLETRVNTPYDVNKACKLNQIILLILKILCYKYKLLRIIYECKISVAL